MENSVFLAKILGPYCIIVALAFLFNLKSYQKVVEDFCKNSALIYLGGVFAFLVGILVVLSHNLWIADWQVIITIFGWLAIIKGTWLILFPNTVAKLTQSYQKKTALLTIELVILLALGILLTVKGYGLASCPFTP
ncbi:MAG: hypothetical protein WC723_04205 [Candidatus Omnitrophota bacterium]